MKRTAAYCLALICVPAIFSSRAEAFTCGVCHSKNPAMVRMHDAVRKKDIGCFDCHRVGDKLMGKGQPKDRGALLLRRSSEQVCVQCHQTEGREERAQLVPERP